MRDECKGCIFEGKLTACAALELTWAWYNMCLELRLPRLIMPRMPTPCLWREEKEHKEE